MADFNFEERIEFQKETPKNVSQISCLQKKGRKRLLKKLAMVLFVFIVIASLSAGYMFYRADSAFNKMTGQQNSVLKSIINMLPFGSSFFQVLPVEGDESVIDKIKSNKMERLNFLLLGMRGAGDPNGGLLTDTIMLVSVKPKTGKIALISIPRDLYVHMPNSDYEGKINEAYERGIQKGGWKQGLDYAKQVVTEVTGLDIHYAASIDFEAFREIIDILGGVTITLDKPFSEQNQFAEGAIYLPSGKQTIDGKTALLFARARFSTSDFDRAKRQQQILLAVKQKAFSLGVLSNPVKILAIFDSIGEHIKTDAELWEIQELMLMGEKIDISDVEQKVFDTSPAGFLYVPKDRTSYILLPKGGNFDKIREACLNIFN